MTKYDEYAPTLLGAIACVRAYEVGSQTVNDMVCDAAEKSEYWKKEYDGMVRQMKVEQGRVIKLREELNALKQEKVVEVTVGALADKLDCGDYGGEYYILKMIAKHYPNGLKIIDGEKVTK
jgi:hypothetical protein